MTQAAQSTSEPVIVTGTAIGAFAQLALAEVYTDLDGIVRVKDSLAITPSFGAIWYQQVDLGFPSVRTSAQDNPQWDGTFDETRYTGARSLSLSGIVLGDAFGQLPGTSGWPPSVGWNSSSYFISQLSGWASPARRYRLYFTDETGRSRFMEVRGDSFAALVDKSSRDVREFQLGMVSPNGKIYRLVTGNNTTADGRYVQVIQLSAVELSGRAYPLSFSRAYPNQREAPRAVFYGGTVPNGFTAYVYTGSSTLSGLRIKITAPDRTVREVGLVGSYVIPAHTQVFVDTNARLVWQVEDHSTTRVPLDQYLNAPLQWPQLMPGTNYDPALPVAQQGSGYNGVQLLADTTPASDAAFTILYHDADLA